MDSDNTQIWKKPQENLKIEFGYLPEKPVIDTFTSLAFSVTNYKLVNMLEMVLHKLQLQMVRDSLNIRM